MEYRRWHHIQKQGIIYQGKLSNNLPDTTLCQTNVQNYQTIIWHQPWRELPSGMWNIVLIGLSRPSRSITARKNFISGLHDNLTCSALRTIEYIFSLLHSLKFMICSRLLHYVNKSQKKLNISRTKYVLSNAYLKWTKTLYRKYWLLSLSTIYKEKKLHIVIVFITHIFDCWFPSKSSKKAPRDLSIKGAVQIPPLLDERIQCNTMHRVRIIEDQDQERCTSTIVIVDSFLNNRAPWTPLMCVRIIRGRFQARTV